MGEQGLEDGWFDGCVCAHDSEKGGHVGVDHTRAFAHACDTIDAVWRGRQGELLGKQLWEGVRCADGAGRLEPSCVCGFEVGIALWDTVQNFLDREAINSISRDSFNSVCTLRPTVGR